jgi:hypothetical protein
VGERLAVATIHPSALLRERDATRREARMHEFVADLQRADAMRVAG